MRKLGTLVFSCLILGSAHGAVKKPLHKIAPDDRGCCDNGKDIKKIRNTARNLEGIVEDIADLVGELDCSDSVVDAIEVQINTINSLVDALLNGQSGCCGSIATSLSFADIINAEIGVAPEIACCDTVTDIQSILSVIDSKVEFIGGEACCNQVVQISSILDSIENKLSLFDTLDTAPCPVTGFINTPTTIAASGHYCLTADVINATTPEAILITASDVFLDLNGHAVIVNRGTQPPGASGIAIGGDNTVVTNGFITTTGTFGTAESGSGIFVTGVDNTIKNVNLLGLNDLDNGITISDSQNVTVDNVCVSNFAINGLIINISFNCVASNSTFFGNGVTGVFITAGSEWNLIENCVAKLSNPSNNGSGFVVDVGCSFNTLSNCIADSNTAGSGFLLGDTTPTAVGAGNIILRCTASNNDIGFSVASDAEYSQLIKECIAINNATAGYSELINDLTQSIIEFVSNVAHRNPSPYTTPVNPVYHTPQIVLHTVAGPQGPSYWSNIITE